MRQLQRRAADNPSLFGDLMRRLRVLAGGEEEGEGGLREQIEELIGDENGEAGTAGLTPAERELVLNALAFGELEVADVMIPRTDIRAIPADAPLDRILDAMAGAMYTRLPVYGTSLDDVIGMVHLKDLLPFWAAPDTFDLAKVMRKVLVVPPSMSVLELLREMRDTRVHMAVVVDEFGGTDGLVTIDDLVGEIIGELPDEHDEATDEGIVRNPDGTIDAAARVDLEDLEEVLGAELVDDDTRDEVDTLGGLIFTLVDRVPAKGDMVEHPGGFVFEILAATPRRIERVRIHDRRAEAAAPGEAVGG